jgi:hypothetical protein
VLVRGLCGFSGKQLQAVSHLLSPDHIKQIKIAMDIPPTNQASNTGCCVWPLCISAAGMILMHVAAQAALTP